MDALKTLDYSPPTLLAIGASVYALYILGTWTYNLLFHPLRSIPGPWYAAISPIWMTIQDNRFIKAIAIEELFQKYGPVVRIEPNVVAFRDPGTMRAVYSATSKFSKSEFYQSLLTNENDQAMTTLEPQLHAPKRRAYGPHYTPNNLSLYQPEMHESVRLLLRRMDEYKGQRSFDCLVLFRRLLVDIIFVSSYGSSLGSLKQWDIETLKEDPTTEIIESINLFPVRGVLRNSVPRPIWYLLSKIPNKGLQRILNSDKRVAEYVIRARDGIVKSDHILSSGDLDIDEGTERLSLIHRLLRQQRKAKVEDRLSDKDIISEAMGHTIAGVDTSATNLSYMLYTLGTRPDVLAKLRAEIDPLMPDPRGEIPDYLVLNRLPYLTGFVKEALRLYGSGPSLLERVVPPSLNGEFKIQGYKIPAGTIVGTQAWSVHRVPSVFPDPYAFKPERWLEETEEMRASMMPFGTGGRLCGGMNLAHYMLRIALTAIIRNFDIVIPPETTAESMACRFAFVLMPAGQKVHLIFAPRKDL